MADVNLNALVEGLSGKVGKNVVMRQRGGRTILSTRPERSGVASEKQKLQRERFQRAVRYARTSLLVPETKAEYLASIKGQEFMTAFTAAVTDYMKAPKIDVIDVDGYTGAIGENIAIRNATPFKLVSVKISIQQANGTMIESGDAISIGNRMEWTYQTTTNIPALAGMKLVVTAKDRPGKEVTQEHVF